VQRKAPRCALWLYLFLNNKKLPLLTWASSTSTKIN